MLILKLITVICEQNFISAMIKTKIQTVLHKNQNHQIIFVQPKKSTENYNVNNEVINEPKHLITFRTIWKFIDSLANICGQSAFKKIEFSFGNYKLIFALFLICLAFPSLFYTIAVYWPNISTLLEVLCLFGILVPVRVCWHSIHAVNAPNIRIRNAFEIWILSALKLWLNKL